MGKLKKILLLTDGIYPYVMGGMQKHSYFLAKHFSLSGVFVEVAHCSSNTKIQNEFDKGEFNSFNKNQINLTHFTFPSIDNFPGHYVRESKYYSETLFTYYQDKISSYDAIYAQGFTGWAFLDKLDSPPIFSNLHGLEMFQRAPSLRVKFEHFLLRKIAIKILLKSNFVYSFGGEISNILKRLNVSVQHQVESPIGIEKDWLNQKDIIINQKRKFVFIGRYERRKGIEELNIAISTLPLNLGEFHFIGPIKEEKQIKRVDVFYHGGISNPHQIQSILRSADVLLCPSYSEGMPTVIMEAMASGMAILATDVGAVSKQVSPSNGVLLKNSIPKSIKNAINKFVYMDNDELLKMKKVSLSKAENLFLWSEVIKHNIKEISKRI